MTKVSNVYFGLSLAGATEEGGAPSRLGRTEGGSGSEGAFGVVAEATLPAAGGAILAAHPLSDPLDVALEARAYGAVAMVRVTPATVERIPHDGPVILVLDDEALADHLELPRL